MELQERLLFPCGEQTGHAQKERPSPKRLFISPKGSPWQGRRTFHPGGGVQAQSMDPVAFDFPSLTDPMPFTAAWPGGDSSAGV